MENSFAVAAALIQDWIELRQSQQADHQFLDDDDLVRHCGQHPCPEAWGEFIRRFHNLIASVTHRSCREWSVTAPDVIEDLIQETYLKLYTDGGALLRRYQSRHAKGFLGYLKTVTAHVVYDHLRAAHAGKRDVGSTVELNEGVNPGQNRTVEAIENKIFFDKIDALLQQRGHGSAENRERTIFWLYYRRGMTCKAIASIPGISLTVKGVESVIYRLTGYLKSHL